MTCNRNHGMNCILPPYIVDHMINSDDDTVRKSGIELIQCGAEMRTTRSLMSKIPPLAAAVPSPTSKKHRLVYDLKNQGHWALPGKLERLEGEKNIKDKTVNDAYRYAGYVYDFYKKIFSRNSLDNNGMSLISSVHFLHNHNNAYWNGKQMIYGDGDSLRFLSFTKSLDIVAHEFSHGVITHTCNLNYEYESGAINEHLSDVMGVMVSQWKKKELAKKADWTIGKSSLGPNVNAKGLRTFLAELAFENDVYLGTDEQPKHISKKYKGHDDYGGVHINSGILNHAFYITAQNLGGHSWEKAGQIWYLTMTRFLHSTSDFEDMVKQTQQAAISLYNTGSKELRAVQEGWKAVGLL